MRVNVYSQELTNEQELVSTRSIDSEGKPATFWGVRLYLRSPRELHHTPDDDDRSAVTIWLPRSQERRNDLASTLRAMALMVDDAPGGQSPI